MPRPQQKKLGVTFSHDLHFTRRIYEGACRVCKSLFLLFIQTCDATKFDVLQARVNIHILLYFTTVIFVTADFWRQPNAYVCQAK